MKPIKLKFYGLNSFIKSQEIDFTELSSGVFGIFGKTGSGKTTILDAIMLSLYGQISKNTKAVDFINSKCDETGVELIFKTGDSEDKTFFVERKYKKRREGTASFAWFGEIVGEDKHTLAEGIRDVDAMIKSKIGLSFNEFSKCIALPQGEFAGFLNATASERTEIISNIFSLQEYGDVLVEKIKAKQNQADTKRQVLEAQKAMLKPVNKEDIQTSEIQLENKQKEVDALQKSFVKLNQKSQEQKRVLNLCKRKAECIEELENLYKQRNEFKEKEILCEKQKRALIIQGEIKRVEELKVSTAQLKEKVLEMTSRKVDAQNKYNAFVSENEEFEKNFQENLISLTKQETALTGAVEDEMQLLSLSNEAESLNEKIQGLTVDLEKARTEKVEKENNLLKTKEEIEKVELQLSKIEESEVDFSLKELKEIESEIIIYETLERQVEKLIDNIKQDIEDYQQEYSKIVKIEKDTKEKLLKEGILENVLEGDELESFKKLAEIQEKLVNINEVDNRIQFVEVLQKQKEQVIGTKQNRVYELRDEYWRADKENKDDRLAELKGEINFVNHSIEEEKAEIEKLSDFKSKLYLKFVDNNNEREVALIALKKELLEEKEKLEKIVALQNEERKNYIALQMKKVEYGTRISSARETSSNLLDLLFGLQKFRAEHELVIYNARERLKNECLVEEGSSVNNIKGEKELELRNLLKSQTKQAEDLAKIEILVQSIQSSIDGLCVKLSNINTQKEAKQKNYNEVVKSGVASVLLKKVKQDIADVSGRFDYNKEKTARLKREEERISREFEINSKILDEQVKELSNINFELKGRIFSLGFRDVDEVLGLITTEKEIFATEESIKAYKEKVGLLEKELQNLTEELDGSYVDEKEFLLLEKELEALSQRLTEEQMQVGAMISSLEIMKDNYDKILCIEKELPGVIKIYDDAKELINIFRGKALVEFIAEEYMIEITNSANEKLNMLMGGRYELEFLNGDFVVYDNFNDRKPRPVQTLSGGETFLVSLSLALAMSETISLSSNKNMEFFFLDEGFGTLDNELIESVISALYKLESQNLKIGLISHVKELEEEIKNKILVEKATDTEGSNLKIVHML